MPLNYYLINLQKLSILVPVLLFGYAVKLVLDEIRIFGNSITNWILALAISVIGLNYLSYSKFFLNIAASLSIFLISIQLFRGQRGITYGIAGALLYYFLIGPLLSAL